MSVNSRRPVEDHDLDEHRFRVQGQLGLGVGRAGRHRLHGEAGVGGEGRVERLGAAGLRDDQQAHGRDGQAGRGRAWRVQWLPVNPSRWWSSAASSGLAAYTSVSWVPAVV